jgi:hypothetical protein
MLMIGVLLLLELLRIWTSKTFVLGRDTLVIAEQFTGGYWMERAFGHGRMTTVAYLVGSKTIARVFII